MAGFSRRTLSRKSQDPRRVSRPRSCWSRLRSFLKSGCQAIDYRDLSVRHLGTLYEGLLEYRLNLVKREPVVVRETGSKRTFVPVSIAGAVKKGRTILDPGKVYFADDKGERKASGSYYTPDDVVPYIVSNTVTPKLEERRKLFDAVREEVERERAIAPTPEKRLQLERYADKAALETVEQGILRTSHPGSRDGLRPFPRRRRSDGNRFHRRNIERNRMANKPDLHRTARLEAARGGARDLRRG